jgi:hypothetical protein
MYLIYYYFSAIFLGKIQVYYPAQAPPYTLEEFDLTTHSSTSRDDTTRPHRKGIFLRNIFPPNSPEMEMQKPPFETPRVNVDLVVSEADELLAALQQIADVLLRKTKAVPESI